MNFICATLLTVFEPEAAFQAFVVFMRNKRFSLADNFACGMLGLHDMLSHFDELVKTNLPVLHQFMEENCIIAASFSTEWFLTLFCASCAESLRILDVFVFKGPSILYAIALTGLEMMQPTLLENSELAMDNLKGFWKNIHRDQMTVVLSKAMKRKL